LPGSYASAADTVPDTNADTANEGAYTGPYALC
jgi:hypothetical protein